MTALEALKAQQALEAKTTKTSITTFKEAGERNMKLFQQLYSGIGSGQVTPSSDVLNSDNIQKWQSNKLQEIAMNNASLFAGMYSLIATKGANPNAFVATMEKMGKTNEDILNFKANADVVLSPKASRSSRIASSAYLQRVYGVDAAKDYGMLNEAALRTDSLNAQLAGKFLDNAGAYEKTDIAIGASTKAPKDTFIKGSDIENVVQAIATMRAELKLAEDNDDTVTAGNLKKAIPAWLNRLISMSSMRFGTDEKKEEI